MLGAIHLLKIALSATWPTQLEVPLVAATVSAEVARDDEAIDLAALGVED